MAKEPNGAGIDLALALNYLGLVYFKQGALNSAMEKFKESLHVCSHSSTSPSSHVAVLYNIARIYLHLGDTGSTINHYKSTIDVEWRDLGNVHPSVGITLKLIGKLHNRCGQFEEHSDTTKKHSKFTRNASAQMQHFQLMQRTTRGMLGGYYSLLHEFIAVKPIIPGK